jgi:tetratricopeptide (TPR) repeat protein
MEETVLEPAPKTEIMPPPSAGPRPSPTEIGSLRIVGELGRGGMGIVLKALDSAKNRFVAVKMILATFDPKDRDEMIARFERESKTAAALRHPGIVSVHEVGVHDGMPYFVMELIEGESLEQRMRRGAIPRADLCALMKDTALALAYAHAHGVVHRDLKPQNVLLDEHGRPHLVDFGLARRIDGLDRITLSGQALGTPSYMSPEQARGEARRVGPRSDIFAIGVMLYRGITGKLPFDGDNSHTIMRNVIENEPPAPRTLDPTIPADLEAITLRCLVKEPENRYASAAEVASELARFELGERVKARVPSVPERAARWVRRNRRLALALAALPVVGLAATLGALHVKEARRLALLAEERKEHAREVAAILEDARSERLEGLSEPELAAKLHALARFPEGESVALIASALDGETARLARKEKLGRGDRRVVELALEAFALLGTAETAPLRRYLASEESQPRAARAAEVLLRIEGATGEGATLARRRLNDFGPGVFVERVAPLLPDAADARDAWTRSFEAGQARFRANDARGAIAAFTSAIETDPTLEVAWLRRAAAELGAYEPERALEDARRASELAPLDAAALAATGLARARLGERELAVATCSSAIALAPGSADAWAARATVHALNHDPVPALTDAARALSLQADELAAVLAQGEAHLDQSEWNQAREDGARAIKLAPRSADGWILRAEATLTLGDVDGAASDTERALALEPESARALAFRAHMKLGAEDFDGAIADATRAVKLDPRLGCALSVRGLARAERGDVEGGRADATRATELEPRSHEAWASLGEILEGADDARGTIRAMTHAIELEPRDASCWRSRAMARADQRDWASALADVSQAIRLEPSVVEAYVDRAWILVQTDDLESALKDCDRAVTLDARAPEAWGMRAYVEQGLHEPKKALESARTAFQLDAKCPIARLARGLASFEEGDFVRAAADLKSVTRARSSLSKLVALDPDVDGYLAESSLETGDFETAIAAAKRVVERHPDSPDGPALLAFAHLGQKKLELALPEAEEVVKLNAEFPIGYWARAAALLAKGDPAAAIRDATKALDLLEGGAFDDLGKQKDRYVARVLTVRALARLAGEAADLDAAGRDLERAVGLDARYAPAFRARGDVLERKGDAEGAQRDRARALELAPRR